MRVEREAAIGGLRESAFEHIARIGDRRLPVWRRDVAEHAGGRVDFAAPRQDLESRRIRVGQEVGFV